MKLTIGQVIDAMEKNGYPLNHEGGYFRYKEGALLPDIIVSEDSENVKYVRTACIYGQAAINLGVNAHRLHSQVSRAVGPNAQAIVEYNDGKRTKRQPSYAQILTFAKKILLPYKEMVIEI